MVLKNMLNMQMMMFLLVLIGFFDTKTKYCRFTDDVFGH